MTSYEAAQNEPILFHHRLPTYPIKMKWIAAILSLGFIASNVEAAPTDGLDLFKLKVTS